MRHRMLTTLSLVTLLSAGGCGENVWQVSLDGSALLASSQPSRVLSAYSSRISTYDANVGNLNDQHHLDLELYASETGPGLPPPPFHALRLDLRLRHPVGGVGGNRLEGFTASVRRWETDVDYQTLPASWKLTLHQFYTDTFEEQVIDDTAGKVWQKAEGVFAFTLDGPGGEHFFVRDGAFDITAQSMNCIPQLAHSCQF